jgi:hypothetical protein
MKNQICKKCMKQYYLCNCKNYKDPEDKIIGEGEEKTIY